MAEPKAPSESGGAIESPYAVTGEDGGAGAYDASWLEQGPWNRLEGDGYASGWAGSSAWQTQECWLGGDDDAWWASGSAANGWNQAGWWGTPASQAPAYTTTDEHTARVHFTKTYQVLSEVLEAHPAAFKDTSSFLDLGCAPGGFAARLLQEHPSSWGFGVTLPVEAGGFPILLEHDRFQVQACNLMELTCEDLDCPIDSVDVCLADAQDLGRRTNPSNQQPKGRGKAGKGGRAAAGGVKATSGGVHAACAVLGIWAMTLQELMLGFSRLRTRGTLCFRFGWRGRGQNEEAWYREATTRLFALLFLYFAEVASFKSEFSHQADASFYVVASGFIRDDYCAKGLDQKLREAIQYVLECEIVSDLPWCFEDLIGNTVEKETRKRITEMLEKIGRLRAIGMASRHRVEAATTENPKAAMIWISPVPFHLTMPRLRECLERYGKIVGIKRRAHPVGVGADAMVQFVQEAHATAALEAISQWKVLGPTITAQRFCDVNGSS